MTENLTEAATLTVVGVLVVFVSLVSLMVAIIVLSRLTSRKGAGAVAQAPAAAVPEAPSAGKEPAPDKETIAAIAVSLARGMAETEAVRPTRKGAPLTTATTSSKWASAGREELMRARRKVGHRWGRPSR